MKKIAARISFLIITLGFLSCSGFDDNFDDLEEDPKIYELAEIRWKLVDHDSSTLIELILPEQIYINQGDTTIVVEVEPLREINGSSKFDFEEPNIFREINLPETPVNAPRNIGILSESYSYVSGGEAVLLAIDPQDLPLSPHITDSFLLPKKTELTYKASVYLRQIKAGFSARFKEKYSDGLLELEGTWTGTFYEQLESEVVVNEIE